MTACAHEPAAFCVLASSSGGNSSALLVGDGPSRRLVLIDAGLSPRRTRARLEDAGVGDVPIACVILTHLDCDHWCPGWLAKLPAEVPVFLHRGHHGRAEREGVAHRRVVLFDGPFEPHPGVGVSPSLHAHDSLGVAVFRMSFRTGKTLGYATDVGRADAALVRHLAGVDVLAIESNYCPKMQVESNRPAFLIRRIMGGSGHLSNDESVRTVRAINPREGVVLLHLSEQCNSRVVAAAAHAQHPVPVILSNRDAPTPWMRLT